jgi:putative transcriptional regulator
MNAMMRVRLKADGRLVEILADGTEQAIAGLTPADAPLAGPADAANPRAGGAQGRDAVYAKGIRARAKLTQAEFAARIGVPIETVRNWEQGKRSPRGPARALLKMIDRAPQVAFAVLSTGRPEQA